LLAAGDALTMKKKYVVDMNMLQAPELPQGIQADGEIDYIIPNVAFLEMCKHDAFLSTMRQALQVFGDHADRVHVTRSVGMCLGDEMRALRLTDGGNMLSDEQSEYGRRLIRDLLSGNMDSAAEIQRELDQARTVVLSADLNADDAKERAQRYLSLIEKGLHADLQKALRSRRVSHEVFIAFTWVVACMYSRKWMCKEGRLSEAGARRFIRKKPLVLRYQFLVVRHTLLGFQSGSDISAMKPEKELNHQLDFDYVLTASYFDGLLSKDKRVNDAHADLTDVLGASPEALQATVDAWFKELEAQHRR
jgi:hypothetical protein